MGVQGAPMEDFDQPPSKFHELNNTLGKIALQNGVILQRLETQEKQNDRIEGGISAMSARLDGFGTRLNDSEKAAIADRGKFEAQILQVATAAQTQTSQVRTDLEKQVMALTANLQNAVERLNPVRLIVFGAATIILSAVLSTLVARTLDPPERAPVAQAPAPVGVQP